MTDTGTEESQPKKRRRQPVEQFSVAGDIARLRAVYAKKKRVAERTVARMRLPTLYFGGAAYILENASEKEFAARVGRAWGQPMKQPRKVRTVT
jgi:hypothetical protein